MTPTQRLSVCSALIWLLLVSGVSSSAQTRRLVPSGEPRHLALVLGNQSYSWSPLRNPVNDARAIHKTLQELGFRSELAEDLDLKAMQRAIRRFAEGISPGDIALFYYSGHGVQVRGENYLIPVDYRPGAEQDIEDDAYSANRVLRQMEDAGARIRIVMLDACRNNPLQRARSASGGLARMEGAGSFVAFAASEGQTADDNWSGQNGLFTTYLLKNLRTPGLTIDAVFQLTRRGCMRNPNRNNGLWS